MLRILTLAASALALLTVSTVHADNRGRAQLDRVAVPKENQALRPQRADTAKARPKLSADDILALQHKVGPYRDQQITLMEQLVEETPDTPADDKADLLFRLAEMYDKKARYLRYRAMELASRIDRAAGNARKKLQRAQRSQARAGKKALEQAAATYARVYRDDRYVAYPRRSEVLFFGARAYAELGKAKESRRAYHRLIKDHPQSPRVAEAYLAFADYYFESGALAAAEGAYQKVLQLPKSPVVPYARYKLAWVQYNLGAFADALQNFYAVTRATRTPAARQQNLYRAARADFVRTYAETGRPDGAHRAFHQVDRGHALDMLRDLAQRYLEQGKNPAAIYVLRELLGRQPKHPHACSWQADIARATLAESGTHAAKAAELHALGTMMVQVRERMALDQTSADDSLSECQDAAGELIGTMARVWHNEGMKTRDRATLAVSAGLYQRYLDAFPGAADRGETEYYRAELLWTLADRETDKRARAQAFERAAHAFSAALDGGRLPADKIKESAYAAVLAWQYSLADGRASTPAGTVTGQPSGGRATPPARAIPIRDQQMLAAFDRYLAHVDDPRDADRPGIVFLKARVFVRHHHYKRAIPLLADIVENHIEHESAAFAVNSLLDALIFEKRDEELIQWVERVRVHRDFLAEHTDVAARLRAIEHTHRRKRSERLEARARASGDHRLYVECGQSYIDLYNRDTEADDGDELLFNAAVCFEEGKSLSTAILIYRRVSEQYRRSALAPRALARLGTAFARAGYYRKAAATLERYARRFASQGDAEQALSDAVFYYRGTGENERALAATRQYIKRHGDDRSKAAEAMYNATAIHEARSDRDRVIAHLRAYLRRHGEAGGRTRQIAAHVRIGELLWQQSCPVAGGAGVSGACIRVERARNIGRRGAARKLGLRARCGDDARIRLKVVSRDSKLARAAKRELNRALTLYHDGGQAGAQKSLSPNLPAELRRSIAAARFLLAEEQYERFLAVNFPAKLDFDPRNPRALARSQARFATWLKEKLTQAKRTGELYRQAQIGDAHYAIASAARMGQISQNFADALFSAEVPRHLRRGSYADERVDAYCDALATEAEPLEKASIDAFGACLQTSTRLGQFSEFSRLCERELGQLRPEQFPTASEIRPAIAHSGAILSVERALLVR